MPLFVNMRFWPALVAALLLPPAVACAGNKLPHPAKPAMDSLIWIVQKAGRPANPAYQHIYNRIARGNPAVPVDTALYYARLATACALRTPSQEDDAEALLSKMIAFNRLYQMDSTLAIGPRLFKIGEKLGLTGVLGEGYYQYSSASFFQGNYKQALGPALKAIEHFKRAHMNNRLAMAYAHFALVFGQDGNRHEVVHYYKLALQLLQENGPASHKALVYNNLGEVYLNDNPPKLDSVLWCLRNACSLYSKVGIGNRKGLVAPTFVTVFIKMGQLDSARFYQRLAEDFADNSEDKETALGALNTRLQLEQAEHDWQGIITASTRLVQLAKDLQLRRYEFEAVRAMAPALAALGQHERAYEMLTRQGLLRDSLFSPEMAKEKQRLIAEFDAALRQQRLDQLERQRRLQQEAIEEQEFYMVVALVAAVIFAATAGFTFFTYSRLQQAQGHLKRLITYTEGQNAQLLETTRTKDKLTGIIAHDLRGPIAGLSLVPEVLDMAIASNDFDLIKHSVDDLRESTSNLSRLLEGLLTWAQSQSGTLSYEPQAVDLHQVVHQTLSLFTPAAGKKGITLSAEMNGPLLVQADLPSLETIIRNLVNNAVKFTRQGGRITVSAVAQATGTVLLQVADTGIGINPQHIPDLFKPGSTRRRPGTAGEKGTGLGLPLVADLVRHNRGELSVESVAGQGSTFSILLPAVYLVDTPAPLPAPQHRQPLAQGHAAVLAALIFSAAMAAGPLFLL